MRVGSLFAGIGGFDLGLERAGMRTVWFVEQDEFCQRVLAKHWPGVPCYPDVTQLRAHDVEPVDVLCGGFPCQDVSYAGRGAGLDGERSGLWSEYARLVGELRPRYVVVENVAALLGRGLGAVLGDLAALGYDAEWDCIPAAAVGAPHRRDRVWIVAYPNADGRGLEVGPQLDGQAQQDPADWDSRRRHADGLRDEVAHAARVIAGDADAEADAVAGGRQARPLPIGGGERGGSGGWASPWAAEPDVGRVAHGVPARVDRLRSLGNALVPQIAEWIGRRIIDWEATDMREAA